MKVHRASKAAVAPCVYLKNVVKLKNVVEKSYEHLDDLFKEIRLLLAQVRINDPENGNKLKSLVRQLELWVDSLVIESIRLKTLEAEVQRRKELARELFEQLNSKSQTDPDRGKSAVGE